MSVPEERKNNRPSKKQPPPTANLSDSVAGPENQIASFRIERVLGCGAVVIHLTNRSLKTF